VGGERPHHCAIPAPPNVTNRRSHVGQSTAFYTANALSVHSEIPRASFLSVQRLKTDSLNRINYKEPDNFGLPKRRRVMASISSETHSLHRAKIYEYIQNIYKLISEISKMTTRECIYSKKKNTIPRIALGMNNAS